jgi:hypothetical protein
VIGKAIKPCTRSGNSGYYDAGSQPGGSVMHWAYRWLIAASALLAVGVAIQVAA